MVLSTVKHRLTEPLSSGFLLSVKMTRAECRCVINVSCRGKPPLLETVCGVIGKVLRTATVIHDT